MAQANGKLIADYLRLDTTNAFLAETRREEENNADEESWEANIKLLIRINLIIPEITLLYRAIAG